MVLLLLMEWHVAWYKSGVYWKVSGFFLVQYEIWLPIARTTR